MSKYSYEFNLGIVQAYLRGEGNIKIWLKSMECLKQLEEENLRLRIENAFFKELRRLLFRRRSTENTARIACSLRGEFRLKDTLVVIGMPMSTYMY